MAAEILGAVTAVSVNRQPRVVNAGEEVGRPGRGVPRPLATEIVVLTAGTTTEVASTRSSKDGRYAVVVPNGAYDLVARVGGRLRTLEGGRGIALTDGKSVRIDLVLEEVVS
jgi:hypothetical protein